MYASPVCAKIVDVPKLQNETRPKPPFRLGQILKVGILSFIGGFVGFVVFAIIVFAIAVA